MSYRNAIAAPLYLRHPASLEHETGAHPERADRIRAVEAELERRDWLGWERREAPAATEGQLLRVHPREHLEHVREVCARGAAFDLDTPASPGSWEAALRSAGGACALVEALLGGEAPTGFSGQRPPGHHCEPARPMGFCLFANPAVAARHALDAHGAERVLIFDFDVHHGNGTNEIFHSVPEVLFASIHQWPFYPGTGALADAGSGPGEGYTINMPAPAGSGSAEWLGFSEHVVEPVAREFRPDLILLCAGFDAHRADPLAECRVQTEDFGALGARMHALAAELAVPCGALLEGGYDLDALAASVAATLEGLAGGGPELASVQRSAPVAACRERAAEYWPTLR